MTVAIINKVGFNLTEEYPDLQQGESHPDAVPGSLTEGQEGVRTSLRLLFRTEVVRLKLFRVVVVLLVLHDPRAGNRVGRLAMQLYNIKD